MDTAQVTKSVTSPKPREKEVQAACLQWLCTLPEVRVWRRNVGAMAGRSVAGKSWYVKFGEAGMSDLEGMMHGIHLEIEIKRSGKKPTLDQYRWLEEIRRFGGIAFWCDTIDMCVEETRAAFTARGWEWRKSWEV